jgi:hypothetical protein
LSAVTVGRFPFVSSQGKLYTSCRECRLKYKTGNVRMFNESHPVVLYRSNSVIFSL